MEKEIRFGLNLKNCRCRNNMSQEELAKKLFFTRQTISVWESGKGKPDIYQLDAISTLFNVSLDELMYGKHATILSSLDEIENQIEYAPKKSYIESIQKAGFYSIIDDDIEEFFPIIRVDFTRIMAIAMELKRLGYNLVDVFSNGVSIYFESDLEAKKIANDIYRIMEGFIHHSNEIMCREYEEIGTRVSLCENDILLKIFKELFSDAYENYHYYWIDENESIRGYGRTKEECMDQIVAQRCETYEILPNR